MPPPKRAVVAVFVLALAALAACGGKDPPRGPKAASPLAGTWTIDVDKSAAAFERTLSGAKPDVVEKAKAALRETYKGDAYRLVLSDDGKATLTMNVGGTVTKFGGTWAEAGPAVEMTLTTMNEEPVEGAAEKDRLAIEGEFLVMTDEDTKTTLYLKRM